MELSRLRVVLMCAALLIGFSSLAAYAQQAVCAEASTALRPSNLRPWIGPQGSQFLADAENVSIVALPGLDNVGAAPVASRAVLAALESSPRAHRWIRFGHGKNHSAQKDRALDDSAILELLTNTPASPPVEIR